jgi:hypothetical protein
LAQNGDSPNFPVYTGTVARLLLKIDDAYRVLQGHDGEKVRSPLDQKKRPAGITPPTLSCNCRLAVRFRYFAFRLAGSI